MIKKVDKFERKHYFTAEQGTIKRRDGRVGLRRRPAKALYGLYRTEGSNPSLSVFYKSAVGTYV